MSYELADHLRATERIETDERRIRNQLNIGDVVESDDGGRGMVVWARGRGGYAPMFATIYDHEIRRGPGISTITSNFDGKWRVLSWDEQTPAERIRRAALRWEPPTWREPDEPIPDDETYEASLVSALLSPAQLDHLYDYGVPTFQDLLIAAISEVTT